MAGGGPEVGPALSVLDGFVILLGPVAQLVQADAPGHVDGRQRAVLAGLDRRHVGGCGAGELGKETRADEVRAFVGAVEALVPTLRTAGRKVTPAGRPDAVGV